MNKSTDVIIIKGAPGSGKSTTAKELSHFFHHGVRLEIDTIRSMVISVDWKNQQEHVNMLEASTKLIYEFLRFDFKPVIVIDTFSGNKIERFIEILFTDNPKSCIKIFGLFVTNDELKRRLSLRSDNEFNDFEICKKLNDDVQKLKHKDEYQINTTGLLPSDVALDIYNNLN